MSDEGASIVEVRVADPPDAWREVGFTVAADGRCQVGSVTVRLVGATAGGRGILGWTLRGVPEPTGQAVDGLPTAVAGPDAAGAPDLGPSGGEPPAGPSDHPNGCVRIDHVVVITPDLDRTTAALAALGVAARRTREAGTGPDGRTRWQRFFRLGEVILELVGPTTPTQDGPARFWGLAHQVKDLEATAALLGDRLGPSRGAVQPGRRIASLRSSAGLSVPTAFLSPEPER